MHQDEISDSVFSYLGLNKPLQWAEGKVFPALFWAEERKSPQSPAVSSLHSPPAQELCSEVEGENRIKTHHILV